MKTILVAGAGKSSIFLIDYLLHHATHEDLTIIVADASLEAATQKIGGHTRGQATALDATDAISRQLLVNKADLVLSLLPPTLHHLLALDCLEQGKPIITASYVSPEMKALHDGFREKKILAMCEMGLDPGIDHMTAMEIIHRIKSAGGTLQAFRSYCGGLIAPESDDNPWHYKFSWNPRNIVLAGRDGAIYKEDGQTVTVPYERLFEDCGEIKVEGLGKLAFYANRDSLAYPSLYEVEETPTFLRATLRHPDFCMGWAPLIALGLTNAERKFPTAGHTYASWTQLVGGLDSHLNIEQATANMAGIAVHGKEMELLRWLGIFDELPLASDLAAEASPADVLLTLLLSRWSMRPGDKDMVVMQHEVEWTDADGKPHTITSTLVEKGEGGERTAMAKTVGLPMGILARMLLQGTEGLPTGVCIPTMPEVYVPVLRELEELGVSFVERIKNE